MRLAEIFKTSQSICLATTAAWDRFPTQQLSWLAREAPKRYADTQLFEKWLAFVPAPRTLSPEAESTPLMTVVVSCIVSCCAVACVHFCLSRCQSAAAQRSVIVNATCRDIEDEPEHLLGNDGRLGSFPDSTAMLAGPGGHQTLR